MGKPKHMENEPGPRLGCNIDSTHHYKHGAAELETPRREDISQKISPNTTPENFEGCEISNAVPCPPEATPPLSPEPPKSLPNEKPLTKSRVVEIPIRVPICPRRDVRLKLFPESKPTYPARNSPRRNRAGSIEHAMKAGGLRTRKTLWYDYHSQSQSANWINEDWPQSDSDSGATYEPDDADDNSDELSDSSMDDTDPKQLLSSTPGMSVGTCTPRIFRKTEETSLWDQALRALSPEEFIQLHWIVAIISDASGTQLLELVWKALKPWQDGKKGPFFRIKAILARLNRPLEFTFARGRLTSKHLSQQQRWDDVDLALRFLQIEDTEALRAVLVDALLLWNTETMKAILQDHVDNLPTIERSSLGKHALLSLQSDCDSNPIFAQVDNAV